MCRQLAANLDAATSLEQLQLLVNRHAHQMSAQLFTRAIVKTPQVRALLLEAQPGSPQNQGHPKPRGKPQKADISRVGVI